METDSLLIALLRRYSELRHRPRPHRTDLLFSPTLNMQAQKASDSPRRHKERDGGRSWSRLSLHWPQDCTASPPKRKQTLRLKPQDTRPLHTPRGIRFRSRGDEFNYL